MKIATFNANSIRTRMGIINDWMKKQDPDILCLQETKVQDREFPDGNFTGLGYNVIYRGQKSYNGVAIVSKAPFSEVRLNLHGEEDEPARFISAVIGSIHVFNVYVPQGVAPGTEKFLYKLKWLEDLLAHIKSRYDPGMPIILTGDFNVALESRDVHDPEGLKGQVGFHPEEQAIIKKIIDWGFIDLFRLRQKEAGQYTFWDYRIPNGFKRNMGWRIDYIFATAPVAEKVVGCIIDTEPRTREKPSDHTFLIAEVNV
jgi:exodeoxyribonuclease III